MTADVKNLPNNIISLKKIIDQERKQHQEITSNFQNRISFLEEDNRFLRHEKFGPKSEKRKVEEDSQPSLFDEAEEIVEATQAESETEEVVTTVKSHTRKKTGRKPLPDNLERKEIIHDLSDEEKICPCGCTLSCIGEEVSEKLEVIPSQAIVHKHIRYKYACKNCEGVESEDTGGAVKIANLPPQIIPQGIATPGLLAYLFISKFEDALPYYRQEKMFKRIGVDLSRASMSNWQLKIYEHLKPMINLMRKKLVSGPLIGIDETTVQVLGEAEKSNTSKSYMWVYCGYEEEKPIRIFRYDRTRSGTVPKEYLHDYSGTIQTDGYAGYNALVEMNDNEHAGCWAHARRGFDKVKKASKKNISVMEPLNLIGKLFRIEKKAQESKLTDEAVHDLRQSESVPVVEQFKKWLDKKSLTVPPEGLMGKAITYAQNQWSHLTVFLNNPKVRLDNNLVENAIRPFVVGRKNWLFSGSPNGAQASAALYSIIETVKANGLNTYWYLKYIFEKFPYIKNEMGYETLLPYNITKDQLADHFLKSGVN